MTRTGLARDLVKLKSSNYFVAYIDILGARRFMEQNNDNFLNDLNSIYFDAVNNVSMTNWATGKDIFIKIFSDNILIAIQTSKNDINRKAKLEKIINLVGNFYNNILRHGYLARGAITEGKFYKDENNIFVYGKALTDAVNMEEENAIYPRIIAKKEIRDIVPQYFLEGNDYFYTLNPFSFLGLFDVNIYKPHLIKMLQNSRKDNKIKQKIMWMVNYFNEYNRVNQMRGTTSFEFITEEEIKDALNPMSETKNEKEASDKIGETVNV